jgi:hypothetical protein
MSTTLAGQDLDEYRRVARATDNGGVRRVAWAVLDYDGGEDAGAVVAARMLPEASHDFRVDYPVSVPMSKAYSTLMKGRQSRAWG